MHFSLLQILTGHWVCDLLPSTQLLCKRLTPCIYVLGISFIPGLCLWAEVPVSGSRWFCWKCFRWKKADQQHSQIKRNIPQPLVFTVLVIRILHRVSDLKLLFISCITVHYYEFGRVFRLISFYFLYIFHFGMIISTGRSS